MKFPLKLLLLFVLALSTSCLQTQKISQGINIDQSVAIPKKLAVDYANSYEELNKAPDFQAKFTEQEITVQRDSSWIRGYDSMSGSFSYADLILVPENVLMPTPPHLTQAALIHKDSLNAKDLYHMGNTLNTKHMIYVWVNYKQNTNQQKFHKFLSALVSLGVKTQ